MIRAIDTKNKCFHLMLVVAQVVIPLVVLQAGDSPRWAIHGVLIVGNSLMYYTEFK